ncbi:hypothetical protein HN371_30100 [Candidatus Poribacteria bacterium]|jgi:hypothetical protein|nr:hypothetical protein [Candidatus Poribacteria bacterium]MBT7101290.1 hypothetical protein [Candidatus Poribacteria bacterium]MBT7807965.1 hypothetical protein [Candidatus Poribacteria bacterium]
MGPSRVTKRALTWGLSGLLVAAATRAPADALLPLGPPGGPLRGAEDASDRRPELRFSPFDVLSPNGDTQEIRDIDAFAKLLSDDPRILATRQIDSLTTETDGNQIIPSISADGRYLAFVAMEARSSRMWYVDMMHGARGQVRVGAGQPSSAVPEDRRTRLRNQRGLVPDENESPFELTWSNTHPRKYAFMAEGRVYLGSPSARSARMLLDEKAYVALPRWSPKDRALVFSSAGEESGDIVHVGNLSAVLEDWLDYPLLRPADDPDPRRVSAARERLTGVDYIDPANDAIERSNGEDFASWVDRSRLVYHSYRGANGYDLSLLDTASVVTTETGHRQAKRWVFSESYRHEMYPSMSPRGDRVAFYHNAWRDARGVPNTDDVTKFALFVSALTGRLDGGPYEASDVARNQVSAGSVLEPNSSRYPRWSPDGAHLIYIADSADEKYPIYTIPYVEGGSPGANARPLTAIGREVNCTAVDIARDTGKLIAFSSQVGSQRKVSLAVTNFATRLRSGE